MNLAPLVVYHLVAEEQPGSQQSSASGCEWEEMLQRGEYTVFTALSIAEANVFICFLVMARCKKRKIEDVKGHADESMSVWAE